MCSVYEVTITSGVNCCFIISYKSGFHISGPSMFVCIVFNTTRCKAYTVSFIFRFPLKLAFIFLDLVCSEYVVNITTGVNCCFMISYKSGFNISGPSMFCICKFPLKLAFIYLDLVCSEYVVNITTGVICCFIIPIKVVSIFLDPVGSVYVP